MSVWLDIAKSSATRHINEMAAKIEELEAENLRLKQPVGVLQKLIPLESGRITHGMVESDSEWAKAVAWFDADIPRAEQNDAIAKSNQQIVTQLRQMIVASGIPAERRVMKRRKWESEPAEWASVLGVPSGFHGDGTYTLQTRRKEWEERRRNYLAKRDETARQQRLSRERDEAERAAQIRLVDACRALGLDPMETTLDDAQEAILKRCKYLNLAVAGERTRGDWSEGCYRVENALGRFSIESVTDKVIAEDWAAICEDFEDGRSFRDTTWNYDRIFSELANKDALSLWQKLNGE